MTAPSPIDAEVLRRMRQTIVLAISTRSVPVAQAAAEARGLGRGMQPALPVSVIDAAVTEILRELGAYEPPAGPLEVDGRQLTPAAPEELVDALGYIMRFDERGKARRTGVEYASKLAAEQIVRRLLDGYVVLRTPSGPIHPKRASEGSGSRG